MPPLHSVRGFQPRHLRRPRGTPFLFGPGFSPPITAPFHFGQQPPLLFRPHFWRARSSLTSPPALRLLSSVLALALGAYFSQSFGLPPPNACRSRRFRSALHAAHRCRPRECSSSRTPSPPAFRELEVRSRLARRSGRALPGSRCAFLLHRAHPCFTDHTYRRRDLLRVRYLCCLHYPSLGSTSP